MERRRVELKKVVTQHFFVNIEVEDNADNDTIADKAWEKFNEIKPSQKAEYTTIIGA